MLSCHAPCCTHFSSLSRYRLGRHAVTGPQQRLPQTAKQTRLWARCRILASAIRDANVSLEPSSRARELRESLKNTLLSINCCGIYGTQAAQLDTVKALVDQLEAENPLTAPTEHLDQLAGKWEVLFSTIKILGSKRIKLGLKDMVAISGLTQEIDCVTQEAVNRVGFSITAFGNLRGELKLRAAYEVQSPTRVTVSLQEATLVPKALQGIFEANFDLLLSIFNPQGWLDITYCDDSFRIGRDDKGHIFILERVPS